MGKNDDFRYLDAVGGIPTARSLFHDATSDCQRREKRPAFAARQPCRGHGSAARRGHRKPQVPRIAFRPHSPQRQRREVCIILFSSGGGEGRSRRGRRREEGGNSGVHGRGHSISGSENEGEPPPYLADSSFASTARLDCRRSRGLWSRLGRGRIRPFRRELDGVEADRESWLGLAAARGCKQLNGPRLLLHAKAH